MRGKSMKFVRKYSEEERLKMVEECLQFGSVALIASKYDINPRLLSRWKCCYRRYGQTLPPKEAKTLDEPIPDYKKKCSVLESEKAELQLEIAVLRDLLKKKKM